MSKNFLLNFYLISFLVGVYVNNLLFNINLSLIVLLFLVVLFFNFLVYYNKFKKVFVIIILGFLSGIILSEIFLDNIKEKSSFLRPYFKQKETIIFEIKNLEKINNDYRIYKVKLLKIWEEISFKNIEFLAYFPLNYKLNSWEILKSKVKIYNFKNNGNFKLKDYYLAKNIYFKVYVNNFEKIGYKSPPKFLLEIKALREKLLNTIKLLYPKDEALFLWWILLWAREELPQELKTNFNNSGLTHFIAVSGFNITILIVFFSLFLKYFPIFIRLLLMTFFIILFVLFVWFSIPVIRAAIMGLLAYYILMSWRKANILTIVLLTAFILILFFPYSLNYDISLHLSFLAVLGIIYTQNFFNKLFWFLPDMLAIREAFVLTLSAMTFTLPIMLFDFWQVSILSFLANISVTWTIPIAMLLWFLSIIVYYVYNPLWWIISYFAWIFLKWDILMVNYFGTRNWALLKVNLWEYSNYLKLTYFIVLLFLIIYFYDYKKEQTI